MTHDDGLSVDEKPIPDVTKRFLTFQSAIGIKSECPFCGGKAWGVLAPPDGQPVVSSIEIKTVPFEAKDPQPPTFLSARPAIYMLCQKCGFTRTHTLDPMLEWEQLQQGRDDNA